jgi:uncharacterized protein
MPLPKLFVDTSAWVAISDRRDTYHSQAIAFNQQVARNVTLVVTNYILDETYTLLLINAGYAATLSFKRKFDILLQTSVVDLIWVTPEIANQTWQVFEQFNTDKQWSFTDCTSYVAMKNQGITEVFSFDHHFSQMGFTRLPLT